MPLPSVFAGRRSIRSRQTRFFARMGNVLGRLRSWIGRRVFLARTGCSLTPRESRSPHMEVGRRGEKVAADHLASLGYRVLFRNLRIGGGELDIVALHGKTVVFVEVKSRLGESTEAWERIDAKKRRLLIRAAHTFVRKRSLQECPHRFDVVTVCWPTRNPAETPVVRVYRNAFTDARDE